MTVDHTLTDYTNRDYASLVASMLDLAALKLPEWTDRSENDLGRLLIELFAYTGDVLLYYQDRIANEAFLATAIERRSVIDLLALIGYTLATPAPATAELTLTVPNDAPTPLRIEVGARFATQAAPGKPAIEFIYLPVTGTALEIPRTGSGSPKTLSVTISGVNATRITHEILGVSTGQANQSFRLTQRPVLLPRDPDSQEYLQVEVDRGSGFEVWQRRGTLLYSLSRDSHFTVQINADDEAELLFGDGRYGQIPPLASPIRATYLVGGGAAGNVGANTITVVKSGVNLSTKVTNPQAASGGADRESIESARRQAPRVFRSMQRAVTAEDYRALAETVPGVARAIAVARSWNYVDLHIVAAGNPDLTDDLRARLLRYFDERRMVTTLVSVRSPIFVAIAIAIVELGVEPTFYREDVQRRVEESLAALFEIDRLSFGQAFYLSKVYEAIEEVPGVAFARGVTFQGRRSDPPGELVDPAIAATGLIQLRPQEFPRQSSLTLLNVTGGLG
jgi:Baseplate J-like protein